MRKMTIGVWRASVDNVSGLPPCPDDMSHPAYVNLLFDSHCHVSSGLYVYFGHVELTSLPELSGQKREEHQFSTPCSLLYAMRQREVSPLSFSDLLSHSHIYTGSCQLTSAPKEPSLMHSSNRLLHSLRWEVCEPTKSYTYLSHIFLAHGVSHCSIKERDDFLKEIRSLTEGRVEFAERKVAELKIRKSVLYLLRRSTLMLN